MLKGDCLKLMSVISDRSVDLILCDLPYGVTDAFWDKTLPFDSLWREYGRVAKLNANIVLFCSQPFTTKLINSQLKSFRYTWTWLKNTVSGAVYSHVQPMRKTEDIAVFSNPERLTLGNTGLHRELRDYLNSERKKCGKSLTELSKILGTQMTSHYFTAGSQFSLPSAEAYKKLQSTGYFARPYTDLKDLYQKGKAVAETQIYNPQGLGEAKARIHKAAKSELYGEQKNTYITEKTGWPHNVLQFNRESKTVHPTQKPVALLEYLIKTYTNPGGLVLDNCMGSGSTGVAAVNCGRRFIGMELTDKYFAIAKSRIEAARNSLIPSLEAS